MPMQEAVVAFIILLALAYLARRVWRIWTGKSSGACHCSAANCERSRLRETDNAR
ncbi:MAG: hypothetical protein IT368_18845 [Candidatus Hydrogenedentes bacterium]|nr:hypothetical protein [Candidatus Hydrogenedentota bacterium]